MTHYTDYSLDRFSDTAFAQFGLLMLVVALIGGLIWAATRGALTQYSFYGRQPDVKPFPAAPVALPIFPVEVADREFAYLENIFSGAVRGAIDLDAVIRPFKDHITDAIAKHNVAVAKHNADVAKFAADAAKFAADVENKYKGI